MSPHKVTQGLKIALVFDDKAEYLRLGYSEEDCCDLVHDGEIGPIREALEASGHQVTLVPGIHALVKHLGEHKGEGWDLAFNMAEGFFGTAREAQVPCLLEAYQVPFTFSGAATMALCLDKAHTKVSAGRIHPSAFHRRQNE